MIQKEKILTYLFFIFFLFFGFSIFRDFGISIDEDNSRTNGLVSLKYIIDFFYSENSIFFNNLQLLPNISEYKEQGNGVIFDLPLAFIELFFKIDDFRKIYLLRHLTTFIIFYVSCIFFYKIVFQRYKSYFLSVLAVIFLITSPRIFAESFYNTKDIGFMSLCIISTYYGINFIKNQNPLSILKFTLFAALAIDARIIGIFLPFIFFLIYLIDVIRYEHKNKKILLNTSLFFVSLFLFIIFFWPYLWSSPLENFLEILKKLSVYAFPIKNFYMGSYINAMYVPWHYNLTWIFITTPLPYLFFFIFGFYSLFKRTLIRLLKIEKEKNYNDLWRSLNESYDLIFLLCLIIPLFTVIILNSSLYTGWRHFYFIYPYIILIAIYGVRILQLFYIKNKKILTVFCLISILPSLIWQFENHPHQNIYFNYLLKNKFDKYFDVDYWGVTNYQTLLELAKNSKKKIVIKQIGDGDLLLTKKFLPKEYRDKIRISFNINEADFLLDNFNRWNGIKRLKNQDYINDNFDIFYELKIGKSLINRIYKRTNY